MTKDTAGSQVWTIGKLVEAVDGAASQGVRVVVPKFQRRLVWKEEQRRRLIESIFRGYPIGAILLSKRPNDSSGREVYQIVDGLQRTSTLVRYTDEPLAWAPEGLLPGVATDNLAKALNTNADAFRQELLEWLRARRRPKFTAGYEPAHLANHLRDAFSIEDEAMAGQIDALGELLDSIEANANISAVSLPVVTYSGPEEELPEIFERINQSGTKLSKYEVFAASWIDSSTVVNSAEVRTAVNEKYAALKDRGFTIEGLEKDVEVHDFNLFEYLFGFGKALVKNHPLLFAERQDPAETEPAAFSLTCVTLGHQLAQMDRLPSFMPRAADNVIDPGSMESAISTAAEAVERWLRPYLGLRLNAGPDGGLDFAHGELQIVSMIARAVVGRWETLGEWVEKSDWKSDWDNLERAIPQHYLLDLLEEGWRGPIYTKLYNRVWSTDDDGEILGPASHYATSVQAKTFLEVSDRWFVRQLEREQRIRPHVRAIDRTFLRFVYSSLVSVKEDAGTQFELEHLFPVSRLKKIIAAADGPGWPISSIANLALFTKALNREKSSSTISEHVRSAGISASERAMVDKFLLCEIDDVAIDDDLLTRDEYVEFLQGRWERMRSLVMSILSLADTDGGP